MDWKEILLAKSEEMGIKPEANEDTAKPSTPKETFTPCNHPPLHIVVEKKGRGGKTATIIEEFECSEDELKHIAAQLKNKLGVGGSARGGEILIQGDCRERLSKLLKEMGFKLKG